MTTRSPTTESVQQQPVTVDGRTFTAGRPRSVRGLVVEFASRVRFAEAVATTPARGSVGHKLCGFSVCGECDRLWRGVVSAFEHRWGVWPPGRQRGSSVGKRNTEIRGMLCFHTCACHQSGEWGDGALLGWPRADTMPAAPAVCCRAVQEAGSPVCDTTLRPRVSRDRNLCAPRPWRASG